MKAVAVENNEAAPKRKRGGDAGHRAAMQAAISAIAEKMGETGGSANKAARILGIATTLKLGAVKTRKGAEKKLTAAKTASMVAKLLKLGGTPADVPEEVRTRYAWKDVSQQLMDLAATVKVESKDMLTAFGLRMPVLKPAK